MRKLPLLRLIVPLLMGTLAWGAAARKVAARPAAAQNNPGASQRAAAKPAHAQAEPALAAAPSALALTYRLLKKAGASMTQVDESETFHSGDLIRLRVNSNQDAHLYIGLKASQGTWDVLLPDPKIMGGENRIRKDAPFDVPLNREDWFEFDDQPGEEHLFLVLSRGLVKDIEDVIRTRPQSGGEPDRPAGRDKLYLAQNRSMNRALVENLKTRSRGMKRVTVAEDRPPEARQERTVYIENREPGALIVIEVVLKHRK